MAIAKHHFNLSLMLILGLLIALSLDFSVAQIGVAYGNQGDNLPPASRVVELYKQYGIQRMRIYEPDPKILDALSGSNIELTFTILNRFLPDIANSQDGANEWLQTNVVKYVPGVSFRTIIVGNEISPTSENNQYVLQALQNIGTAISSAGLGEQIKVSTSIATDLIAPPGFPPEDGAFKPEVVPYLSPIIQFVMSRGGPLFASIYPYFSYLQTPGMRLEYALLDPNFQGVVTEYGNTYQNLFDAIYDTVISAVERLVGSSLQELPNGQVEIGGGESGWPSDGGPPKPAAVPDEVVSTVENAQTYINNLIQVVKRGSPKRPDVPRNTFIFAMFDENMKNGSEDEKHFGLFLADGTPKYTVNFN